MGGIYFNIPDSVLAIPTAPWTDTFENLSYWTDIGTGGGTSVISSNALRQNGTGTNFPRMKSIYQVSGDFSIQVDYDSVLAPSTHGYFFMLSVQEIVSLNTYQFSRAYHDGVGGHKIYALATVGGTGQGSASVNSIDPGKLKIDRSGNSWTVYYWDGSWQSLQTKSVGALAVKIELRNQYSGGSAPERTVDWDNFTINSGTIMEV